MSIVVRKCVPEDWRSMSRLRASRTTHAGVAVSTFTSNPLTTVSDRFKQEPHVAIGCWEDAKLVAFICCYSDEDFWVLDLMVSNGDPSKLQQCLDKCLEHYESRGITQFYYAFPQKWARAYRSFWKAGAPLLRKYTIEDRCVIEARKRPIDPFIWEHILHEIVVPVPFLLRRSYVQNI
jgi:hypothetical protein